VFSLEDLSTITCVQQKFENDAKRLLIATFYS